MTNPEIARTITAAGIRTNVHDLGNGAPVLLIHGSGPGVSAWANWRLLMPELAKRRRVIAPDMVGFAYTERPANPRYDMDTWVGQAVGLLDALEIARADLQVFAVTGIPDERKGEQLAVLHTLDESQIPGIVSKLTANGLPNLYIPPRTNFIRVDALPVLGTGKMDLRSLKRIATERLQGG